MIVLDTSAAIEIARQTPMGEAFCALVCEGERCISCDLMIAEAASVFRKLACTEGVPTDRAMSLYDDVIDLVDEFYPLADLRTEALSESIRLDHSTYDLFYFVLARRTGSCLVTADRKLMHLCEENGIDCVHEVNPFE